MLLDHGADPNGMSDGGGTPMSTAYRRQDRAMLDLLTRAGGVVSAGTAAYHGDVAIARLRIEEEDAGRLPPGAVSPGGRSRRISWAATAASPRSSAWRSRASTGRRTIHGGTARCAVRCRSGAMSPGSSRRSGSPDASGYLESFRLILARCHANVRGSFGRTILHDVMAMGFHDGASGWITEDEALAFAVTLLDAGARTDVRDDLLKSTPLGWACRWGRTPIVKELLRRGVDPIEPDAAAWATPRAWAEKMGHREIVAML